MQHRRRALARLWCEKSLAEEHKKALAAEQEKEMNEACRVGICERTDGK